MIDGKKFFIQKYDLKDVKDKYGHDIAFMIFLTKGEALDPLHPKYISVLFGDKGGVCDSAQTDENYERCGLTTSLMTSCFQDADITRNGGVDANDEEQFKNNPEKQKEAINECEKIVTLNQNANPPAAGKAYTKAAINAGFKKVFTVTPGGINMRFWTVDDVEEEYLKNPIKFIQQYGQQWFFCKCKRTNCTIS